MPRVRAAILTCVAAAACASTAGAQTPSMPSTLRYGSGLLDIPVSSVLGHMEALGTFSGSFVSLDRNAVVDDNGNTVGYVSGGSSFLSDAALAVGLFDRMEMGASLQALGDEASGGNVWGLFGRVRLWEPVDQGLGFAVGARYLTGPSFGDGREYAPGRLGFPDPRLLESSTGSTNLSLYGVTTAYVRGFDGGPLPEHDMTFSLGYGTGMFKEGGTLGFYAPGHANGWFYGTSLNVSTGSRSMLTVMAEHNGFDVNVGAQFDWDGFRFGVHYLASNHAEPNGGWASEYQKPKLGLVGSIAVCPGERGFRCRPRMMRRSEPDTIYIPPPPPDTILVAGPAAAVVPDGREAAVCLSTGQNVPVQITEAGDTLVGPGVPLRELRPALDFAGGYAAGALWYESGQAIEFEGDRFGRAPETFPIDCEQILRVGAYQGVPVFADRAADRPLVLLFMPVRPGLWRRYERGLP